MVLPELEQWLSDIRVPLGEMAKRVDSSVRSLCADMGYAYASRNKLAQSASEKLETGRIQSLENLDDLFGCTIIVPSLSHEQAVVERLEQMFQAVTVKRRGQTMKSPDVFRFEATRFIGRLRLTDADDPRLGLPFEIQVRTAFEHAWSVATHGPAYKGVTVGWKLERLAAQMKALVEQLDALAVAYDQSAEFLVQHPHPRTDGESRILEAFQSFLSEGLFPDECQPEKWGLFAKNIVSLAEAADWGGRLRLEDRITIIIEVVEKELRRIGRSGFPVSLSLYQFTLGLLVEQQRILPKLRDERYFPPISASLETIFPRTRAITQRCNMKPQVHDETLS